MSFVGTTYGDISFRSGVHVIAKSLALAETQYVLQPYARHEKLAKNVGLSVKWRVPVIFNVSTTSLTEGVTPSPQAYDQDYVSATLAQYGSWFPFSDVVADMHEDPILKDLSDLASRHQADVREMLTWETIRAGSNVVYTNGSARTDVNTVITKDDIDSAVMTLKSNYTPKITKRIAASTDIATEPVNASYLLIGNTFLEPTFRGMDSFVPVEKYSGFSPCCEWEIGKVDEVRIILTNYATGFNDAGGTASGNGVRSSAGTSANVYPCIVFGEEAFACATIKGMDGMKVSVTNPKMGSENDPLGQRGHAAWKFWFVAKILNDNRMVRIETAAPSL